jgi:hypothetical protein
MLEFFNPLIVPGMWRELGSTDAASWTSILGVAAAPAGDVETLLGLSFADIPQHNHQQAWLA